MGEGGEKKKEGGGGEWGRLSARDVAVLEFVARFGVVPRGAVARREGTARSMTLRREKRLRDAGLLRVEKPLEGDPYLLATALGLEVCGRGDLFPARIALVRLAHFTAVVNLAVTLEAEGRAVLSERELLAYERAMGERLFSVTLADGSHHRPDLILLPPGHPLASSAPPAASGRSRRIGRESRNKRAARQPMAHARTRSRWRDITGNDARASGGAEDVRPDGEDMRVGVIEVELTPKGSARLDAIVVAYHEAVDTGHFSSVRYLCSEEALPFVRRSVERTGAAVAVAVGSMPAQCLPQPKESG